MFKKMAMRPSAVKDRLHGSIVHEYSIHPRVGLRLLGTYLPELGINSCVWLNSSFCWAEGEVPGGIRTRGCRTTSQLNNH